MTQSDPFCMIHKQMTPMIRFFLVNIKNSDQCNIIPKTNDSWGSRAFKQSVYKDKLTIWLNLNLFIYHLQRVECLSYTSKIKIITKIHPNDLESNKWYPNWIKSGKYVWTSGQIVSHAVVSHLVELLIQPYT